MAPVNTRASSISSASSSNSKCTDAGIKKKFGCSFPGCGKSFSRSEHLHRHALNHKDGNNTCLRCSAHFRRRDLLDRHMARHKEKDDEAGGEGLGILATRKRLWRDTDGNIVNARRPSYTQDGAKRRALPQNQRSERKATKSLPSPTSSTTPMSRAESSASSTIIVDTGAKAQKEREEEEEEKLGRDNWLHMTALPSPPSSAITNTTLSSAAQSPNSDPIDDLDALYEDSWPPLLNLDTHLPSLIDESSPGLSSARHPISSSISNSVSRSMYPPSPSWGPQPFSTFMGAVAEAPYEDTFSFKAETGMYDWQAWNSQVLMSRCREEKPGENFEEKRGFMGSWDGRRFGGYGMGTC